MSTGSLSGEELSGLTASLVRDDKVEPGRRTTPNRYNAEEASSSAEKSHTQIWEESGLKTMDASDRRLAFMSSPASFLEMDVNRKQIRSLSVEDF